MRGYPTRYIVVDTETNTTDDHSWGLEYTLHFRLGVAKTYDPAARTDSQATYLYFNSPGQFHRTVCGMGRTKDPIWVFAHNAGFDLRILQFFDAMADGIYNLHHPDFPPGHPKARKPLIVLENPPLMIRTYREDGQEVMWCDTFQWINMGLRKIGENMGIEKGEMPLPDAPLAQWYAYCQRDVDVLDRALINIWQWLKSNKVSTFQPTRAGQAKFIFREKYEQKRICYTDDHSKTALDRHAYYGGRTDLWFVGVKKGPIHQVDINSLYPYVMKKHWYPVEVIDSGDEWVHPLPQIEGQIGSTTAEVYLTPSEHAYPVRCRAGTWFVGGHVRTILCGPELRFAWERGDIAKIGRWTRYRMGNIFATFIDDYWRMRTEAKERGDKVSDLIIKLLMNSLYGKFGQKTGEWIWHDRSGGPDEFRPGILPPDENGNTRDYQVIAGHTFYRTNGQEAKGSFIPIAAYVTSYARCFMDKLRDVAGEGHYYYQATDSLYVDDEGLANLRVTGLLKPTQLGRFKHEGTYSEVRFRNIHNLDKDAAKVRGSVKPSAHELSPDFFECINWESLKSGLMSDGIGKVTLRKIWKRLNPVYQRQRVWPDGQCTRWTIDNWDITPEDQAHKQMPIVSSNGE